jgi:hypothetical protein
VVVGAGFYGAGYYGDSCLRWRTFATPYGLVRRVVNICRYPLAYPYGGYPYGGYRVVFY